LGVRRIGVFSAPPLGCLPALKTMNGNSGKGCVDDPNEAAKLFNAKLFAELDDLNNNLPHSKVVYIDVYDPLLDIIQNPKKHGHISSFLIFLNLNFLYINLGFLANNLYVVIQALRLQIKGVVEQELLRCLYYVTNWTCTLVQMTLSTFFSTVIILQKQHTRYLSISSKNTSTTSFEIVGFLPVNNFINKTIFIISVIS
jgi:hypothetical protein